jgi:hypothetical protein
MSSIRSFCLVLALIPACAAPPLGQKCTQAQDCGDLACLSTAVLYETDPNKPCVAGGVLGGNICSRQCTSDSDCAGLGSNPACARGCLDTGLCMNQGRGEAQLIPMDGGM